MASFVLKWPHITSNDQNSLKLLNKSKYASNDLNSLKSINDLKWLQMTSNAFNNFKWPQMTSIVSYGLKLPQLASNDLNSLKSINDFNNFKWPQLSCQKYSLKTSSWFLARKFKYIFVLYLFYMEMNAINNANRPPHMYISGCYQSNFHIFCPRGNFSTHIFFELSLCHLGQMSTRYVGLNQTTYDLKCRWGNLCTSYSSTGCTACH